MKKDKNTEKKTRWKVQSTRKVQVQKRNNEKKQVQKLKYREKNDEKS